MRETIRDLAAVGMLLVANCASAENFTVRGDISGNWYNPDEPNHGVQVEVIDPNQAIVVWYVYDAEGSPLWLFGMGGVRENRIQAELYRFSGALFPPEFEPGDVSQTFWGELDLEFDDCMRGEMSWRPEGEGYSSGRMDLVRLAGIEGVRCGQRERFEQSVEFSLDAGAGGWEAMFADYGEAQIGTMDREAEWRQLPGGLADRRGFMLAGSNTPDDLAMFLVRRIGGLQPDSEYQVELDMTMATNVPQGCAGIGGAPGEAVSVKLGATGTRPEVVESDGDFRFNFDKGDQSAGGEDALVVGDMTSSQGEDLCGRNDDWRWELKTLTTRGEAFSATTDAEGRMWILGGSDSGFEGRTTFFITDFSVRLFPLEDG